MHVFLVSVSSYQSIFYAKNTPFLPKFNVAHYTIAPFASAFHAHFDNLYHSADTECIVLSMNCY